MYLDYFGLRQKPFLITPDPAFLYPSQIHQQALAHLHYGLEREGGFILLTGEVGTGKTTLCRLLIEELPEKFRLAYILNTKLDSAGVLAGICKELDISVADSRDVNGLVAAIYDDLLAVHGANRHTLVVIEEAQNLAPDVLETLRLLTNLETSSTKLLHILLIGQPELLKALAQPELRQLNQRVVSRCHLGPLSRGELQQYMPHRIKMAGSTRPLFTIGAISLIHKKTGGIPRLVNLLAEHCLMGAYGQGIEKVTPAIVRQAARELRDTLKPAKGSALKDSPLRMVLPLVAMVMLAGAVAYYSLPNTRDSLLPAENDLATESAAQVTEDRALQNTNSGRAEGDSRDSIHSQDISASQDPVIAEDPSTVQDDAISHLARAWNIEGDFDSLQALCDFLIDSPLACETTTLITIDDLIAINRPILVELKQGEDGWASFTLISVDNSELTLVNSEGMLSLDGEQFFDRLKSDGMKADGTFLWHAPPGYDKPLLPQTVNPPLVDRIKTVLMEKSYLEENLVTGGVYNDYLSSLIEKFQRDHGLDVDGIVGVKTLLQLDTAPGPRLLPAETGEL